jgi:hypothetical protein
MLLVVKIDVSALQVLLPVRFTCFISRVCVLTRRRYLDDLNVQVLDSDARDLPAAREWQRSYVHWQSVTVAAARALQQHAWGVLGV